jgi:hypothetical protein
MKTENVVVEWLALLLFGRFRFQISAPATGYPDELFRDFPQSLQANAGIVP